METLISEISRLLNNTLSPDKTLVSSATDGLDQLSSLPHFPLCLLAIATGGNDQGIRLAAATYLKNLTRRGMKERPPSPELHNEFRSKLVEALLQVEPAMLKVLVESFRFVVKTDFVKEDLWPNIVPELKTAIQGSNLISVSACPQWNTINALVLLQMLVKPFQYFLNPTVAKEAAPSQLEIIAKYILVPLLGTFHHFVDKALSYQETQKEIWEVLLIICKCIYYAVRSYMPNAISQYLPSFCDDLFRLLDSLSIDTATTEDGYLVKLKTAKRTLLIVSVLITRHRKHVDRLIPSFVSSAFRIARKSSDISVLDSSSERIVSLAFDVISHILETGPGWRHVSPHFSSLLDSAIFPALTLNQKDILEWEEDSDEYIRKNLPSELDESSGWAEDLFTARKSAINLLGVIAMSKGPPVASTDSKRKKGEKSKRKEQQSSVGELLVIPFLSKFPLPSAVETSSKILHDYCGVLMAYGGLQDFFNEQNPDYTSNLVRNRVLPLYVSYSPSPYLVATANWVLGALAPCLPQVMAADIYRCLMKSLTMTDMTNCNCYPVRASAAGAIAEFIENEFIPPDWLYLLQILVKRIGNGDENEASLLFQLLGTVIEAGQEKVVTHIPLIVSSMTGVIGRNLPPIPETWPQVVERGFAALAITAQIWEQSMPDDIHLPENKEWRFGWGPIARVFSSLLQQAWLMPLEPMEEVISTSLPSSSCLDDASQVLGFVMRFVTSIEEAEEFKLTELLAVWADLIADWNAWEEMEDVAVFSSIQAAVNLHRRCNFTNYFTRTSQNLPGGLTRSIIEGISVFVFGGIKAYPSATRRACSCVHALLHVPRFSFETEAIRQSMAADFAQTAFYRFKSIENKSQGLWKPLLLAISSCYIIYPENIKQLLDNLEDNGFIVWASALATISTSSFEPGLSTESEIKLAVITLTKVVEHLPRFLSDRGSQTLHNCFRCLMEACIRLKEVQKDGEGSDEEVDDDEEEDDDDDDSDDDDDEESEDDEREETQDEFLERYAKVAAELKEEVVEEGDSEDEAQELELGNFDNVDIQTNIITLLYRYRQVLIQGQVFTPKLVEGILNTCPEYSLFFQGSH